MDRRTYRLRHEGSELTVEVWLEGSHNHARLLIDGTEAAAGRTDEAGHVDLTVDGGPHVKAQFWWKGRVWKVALVEKGPLKSIRIAFEPPAGTRAARSYAFGQRHPGLYAARHVVINVGGTIAAILGIGVLVSAFFGRLLPSLDLSIPLPDIDAPDWLRWLDPGTYLAPVARWIAGWMPDLSFLNGFGKWGGYVIGFLIACAVAVQEYRRRKRRLEDDGSPAEHRHDGPEGGEPDGADR